LQYLLNNLVFKFCKPATKDNQPFEIALELLFG